MVFLFCAEGPYRVIAADGVIAAAGLFLLCPFNRKTSFRQYNINSAPAANMGRTLLAPLHGPGCK